MINQTPTAPEFISVLKETAEETLIAYLRRQNAPESVILLVSAPHLLEVKAEPEDVVEVINLIVECGGVFHAPSGVTLSREVLA